MAKPRPSLLVVSGVLPYPGTAGQQQRVRQKLLALRTRFSVSFLTALPRERHDEATERLAGLCDESILLASRWRCGPLRWVADPLAARLYALATGLKTSNYALGRVELPPGRVVAALAGRHFDVAVFEYWHTVRAAAALRRLGTVCVLDMHDLLWQSRRRQLAGLPVWLRELETARYRRREEAAWSQYDALITINRREHQLVGDLLPSMRLVYAPMGVDMERWSYGPEPAEPPRLGYYGGLGSAHNRRDAWSCYRDVMPRIWRQRPDAELWIVGSDPPDDLLEAAAADPRLVVTGFVDDVRPVLRGLTAVLCPWTGTYGFRSRLIEVMALGIPVVASTEAVDGMDLRHGEGTLLADAPDQMADQALGLLTSSETWRRQSGLARRAVETSYSFDATYGEMAGELASWLDGRQDRAADTLRADPGCSGLG